MKPAPFKHPFPKNVKAFWTDISMDFVLPLEAKGLSLKQKDFLAKKYRVDPEKIFTIRQVHGNTILTITEKHLPQKGAIPEADGVVSHVPGIVLSVRTADCLPIFLYDPQKKCVGLVHAGWKGSAQKIAAKAAQALAENYGSHAADIWVCFGPGIRPCCYEVGEEFEKIFPQEIFCLANKRFLDLPLVNKKQLMSAGVRAEHIFDSAACTVCGKGFFSYRRDKEKAGRHLSLITIM